MIVRLNEEGLADRKTLLKGRDKFARRGKANT
jgi:hypothetical protein